MRIRVSETFAVLSRRIPVAAFWKRHGEAAFRELEREIVLGLPSDGAVVALGGGTVTHLPTRRMLATRGVLITLTAPVEVLRNEHDLHQRPRGSQLALPRN